MMDGLLINPLTKQRLEGFLQKPSHALLLSGQPGSGLSFLASQLRHSLTKNTPDAAALVQVDPNDKGTIPIEEIRGLSRRLKLRNQSGQAVSICVVINGAEAMAGEAQNALLKLLEEPPQGVLFILLAHDAGKILPTISSRCVCIDVLPVPLQSAEAFFGDTSQEFHKNYHLSGGQPGLLYELKHQRGHPLVSAIDDAKRLLTATAFDRIKTIEQSYKQRDAAKAVTEALLRVCSAALQSGNGTLRWLANTKQCQAALQKLEANVQAKLVLDELFLNLR